MRLRTAIVAACLTLTACSTGVFLYQVPHPAVYDEGNEAPQTSYWSAHAFLEGRNFVNWNGLNTNVADYILVSAQVKLPAKGESVSSEIPLFLIQKGVVAQQVGVDLLKRFPIHPHSREQVTIQLKAQYIANRELARTTQLMLSGLSNAVSLAQSSDPTLSLKIVGEFNKALNAVISSTDTAPESTLTLHIDNASARHAPQAQLIILTPLSMLGDESFELRGPIEPCVNKPEAICYATPTSAPGPFYEKSRVDDVVYVTLRFIPHTEVFDRLALLEEAWGDCDGITRDRINEVRSYFQTSSHLFTSNDADGLRRTLRLADHLVEARSLADRHDYTGILEIAGVPDELVEWVGEGVQSPSIRSTLDAVRHCVWRFWEGRPVVEVRNLYHALNEPCGSKEGDAFNACSLDRYGFTLRSLADLSGAPYTTKTPVSWQGNRPGLASTVHSKAYLLAARQKARTDEILRVAKGNTRDICSNVQKFMRDNSISAYCDECVETLRKTCTNPSMEAAVQDAETAVRGEIERAVRNTPRRLGTSLIVDAPPELPAGPPPVQEIPDQNPKPL